MDNEYFDENIKDETNVLETSGLDQDIGEENEDNNEIEPEEEYPKLFQHCARLYDLLEQNAQIANKAADGSDAINDKMYIGSITPLVAELGISISYQSKIISRLKQMGSVAMLKRGSGAAKSVWGLYRRPTISDFHASDDTGDIKWKKEAEKYDATLQRINDLSRRLSDIEAWAREQGMIV